MKTWIDKAMQSCLTPPVTPYRSFIYVCDQELMEKIRDAPDGKIIALDGKGEATWPLK